MSSFDTTMADLFFFYDFEVHIYSQYLISLQPIFCGFYSKIPLISWIASY